MGRKQKKKATQRKKISQKMCAEENEEDKTSTDCCSCDPLSCSCNIEDSEYESESNVMDLEEKNYKLKNEVEYQQILFNERECIYKNVISTSHN